MVYEAKNIRNVALFGHQGSGKTSLVESLYAAVNKTEKGSIEKGNTISDYQKEEKKSSAKRKELDLSIVDSAFREVVDEWLGYKSERGEIPFYRAAGYRILLHHQERIFLQRLYGDGAALEFGISVACNKDIGQKAYAAGEHYLLVVYREIEEHNVALVVLELRYSVERGARYKVKLDGGILIVVFCYLIGKDIRKDRIGRADADRARGGGLELDKRIFGAV